MRRRARRAVWRPRGAAAAWAWARAWSTSAVVASCTVPTTSLWSAGLRTGWVGPVGASAPSRGAAVQAWAAVACRVVASSVSVFSFERSSPRELVRWAPYRPWGVAMRGWGQARSAFCRSLLVHHLQGVLHQLVQRNAFVGDPVHEGGVGAVLQQAAHQVGQQRLMRAHGGVDAAGAAQFTGGDGTHHLLIQWLTHAVQALELILPRVVAAARQLVNGGYRLCVVGGELGGTRPRARPAASWRRRCTKCRCAPCGCRRGSPPGHRPGRA